MWNLPASRYVKAFEPQLKTASVRSQKARSCSEDTQMSSSSEGEDDDNNMLPEIVPVSSLGSFSDSTVSSGRASPATLSVSPPRSIFKNYWSSPRSSGEGDFGAPTPLQKGSGLLLYKLSSLSLPLVDGDEDEHHPSTGDDCPPTTSLMRSSSAQAAPSPKMTNNTKAFPIDDSTIDYGRNNNKRPSVSTPRRQILPTVVAPSPPPPRNNVQDLPRVANPLREQTQRKWSSTTALIKRPTHSCLRPSRYSCSMIDERELLAQQHQDTPKVHEDAAAASSIAARAALSRSKSVSFYSQVSVFEFVKYSKGMEDARPSKDWSKYFA
mmetsp:Transcript_23244/g.35228  ORF Transcript_23244/g.35228 Transcript_23244/m.35228 type:complete len:324 (+) Transcript_23244:551-1522(+)